MSYPETPSGPVPERTSPTERPPASSSTDSIADSVSEKTLEASIHHDQDIITPQISRVSHQPSLSRKVTSIGTTGTSDPNFEVDWDGEDDPNNPHNWSLAYKGMAIAFLSWNTLVVVLYSTSYTAGIQEMAKEFGASEIVTTLGLTSYLLGLAVGSVVLAPLSEMWGRKPITVACLFLFVVLIIPSGLAKSIEQLIIVRFLNAVAGSSIIASAPGQVADMVSDDRRALALSIWSLGPLNGPVLGPIVGGFVTQYLGWRWANWVVMILGGLSFAFACILKETYAPALLRKKAAQRRKETDDPRWWCRYDQKQSLFSLLKVNLSRPFVMAVVEPICIFWNIYISLVYAILYLCFVAYPIVFRQIRGWSIGLSGLAFVGIGVGGVIVVIMEPVIRRMINSHKKDPETGKVPPEAMVSAVCIAAVLIPVGQLWFAWTSAPASIHWILPILAGVPFGGGNTTVFIYANNYITHSYGIYAASALAGNAVIRSVMGGVLPLVGPYMYDDLGPNWAATLLGLLEVAIIPIPLVFYRYGHKIRMKSSLIRAMQEDKKRLEGKRNRAAAKRAANDRQAANDGVFASDEPKGDQRV
ncbi:hypothetical protein VTO42DRAFT_3183 [Malbranchea cinnamomea]